MYSHKTTADLERVQPPRPRGRISAPGEVRIRRGSYLSPYPDRQRSACRASPQCVSASAMRRFSGFFVYVHTPATGSKGVPHIGTYMHYRTTEASLENWTAVRTKPIPITTVHLRPPCSATLLFFFTIHTPPPGRVTGALQSGLCPSCASAVIWSCHPPLHHTPPASTSRPI